MSLPLIPTNFNDTHALIEYGKVCPLQSPLPSLPSLTQKNKHKKQTQKINTKNKRKRQTQKNKHKNKHKK
jgi:hypothetical protein